MTVGITGTTHWVLVPWSTMEFIQLRVDIAGKTLSSSPLVHYEVHTLTVDNTGTTHWVIVPWSTMGFIHWQWTLQGQHIESVLGLVQSSYNWQRTIQGQHILRISGYTSWYSSQQPLKINSQRECELLLFFLPLRLQETMAFLAKSSGFLRAINEGKVYF